MFITEIERDRYSRTLRAIGAHEMQVRGNYDVQGATVSITSQVVMVKFISKEDNIRKKRN